MEASSGNSAASEAYFFNKLKLRFIAFASKDTSKVKLELIKKYKGNVHLVEGELHAAMEAVMKYMRDECSKDACFYMNQFGNAAMAEDYFEGHAFYHISSNKLE